MNDQGTIPYTRPNQIDGDPAEVRAKVIAQLRDVAYSVGEIVDESSKQIRSADLSVILSKSGPKVGRPTNAVIEWEGTESGRRVADLRAKAAAFIRAVANLVGWKVA